MTHFRSYLYGRKFTFVIDHKPLVWFQNSKDPCLRVSRWRLKLARYDFDVIYKAGKIKETSQETSLMITKRNQNIYKLMTMILL